MKGKMIIFGTILAVFLMIITPTISAVNANVCEKQTTNKLLGKINDFKDKANKFKEFNLDIFLLRLMGLMFILANIVFFGTYISGGVFAFIFIFSIIGLVSGLTNGEIFQRMIAGAKIGITYPFANFVFGMNLLFGEGEDWLEIWEKATKVMAVENFLSLLFYLVGISDSPDPELE